MRSARFRRLGKLSAARQQGASLTSRRNRSFDGFAQTSANQRFLDADQGESIGEIQPTLPDDELPDLLRQPLAETEDLGVTHLPVNEVQPLRRGTRKRKNPDRYSPSESNTRHCRRETSSHLMLAPPLLDLRELDTDSLLSSTVTASSSSLSNLIQEPVAAEDSQSSVLFTTITDIQSAAIVRTHQMISNLSIDRCRNCFETWFEIESQMCKRCRKDGLLFGIASNPSSLPDFIRFSLNARSTNFNQFLSTFEIATLAEKSLISQVTLFLYIFRKRHVAGAGDFMKGSFIAFPEGHPALQPIVKLPRSAAPFVTVRTSRSSSTTTFSDFRVRRAIVLYLLEWLIYHSSNPLYSRKSELIDQQTVNGIPEDSFIETLQSTEGSDEVSILNQFSQSISSSSTTPSALLQTPDSSQVLQDDVPDCHHEDAEKTRNQYFLVEAPLQNLQPMTVSITTHQYQNPLPTWSPMILLGAFPLLFISSNGLPFIAPPPGADSDGVFYPQRRFQLSFKDVVEHLLRLAYTRLDSGTLVYPYQDSQFVAYCRQILMSHAINRNVRFFIRKNELGDLTIPQLLETLTSPQGDPRIIQKCLSRSCESFSGSPAYWAQRKMELWEIARQTDSFNCFYTITIGDLHHPILLELLGVRSNAPIQQRSLAISRAPGLVDAFFFKVTRIIVNQFLKEIGFKLDYTRFEYQARGQAHAHGMGDFVPFRLKEELTSFCLGQAVKCLLLPDSTESSRNCPTDLLDSLRSLLPAQLADIQLKAQEAEVKICSTIDQYISNHNPLYANAFARLIQRQSAGNSESNEIVSDLEYEREIKSIAESYLQNITSENGDDPLTTAINSILAGQLENVVQILIQRCMIHKCSKEYCRTRLDRGCRFGHPHELTKHSRLKAQFDQCGSLKISLSLGSNDPYLHPYMGCFLAAVAANCDFTCILDRNSALAYVVKYISKTEPSDEFSLRQVIRRIADPTLSVSNAVRSVAEKIVGNQYRNISAALSSVARNMINSRTVSIQEAIHVILGTPLYNTSVKFKRISTNLQPIEVDLTTGELKGKVWMTYANRLNFQTRNIELQSSLPTINADTFFRTLTVTKGRIRLSKEPYIVLYSSASIQRPPETCNAFPSWIRWFFIRWIPWETDAHQFFLEQYRSRLSHELQQGITPQNLDDFSNSLVSDFWRKIFETWKEESPSNRELVNRVSVERNILAAAKQAAKTLQRTSNPDDELDSDELGNEIFDSNQLARVAFSEHFSQDSHHEIPDLAPASLTGVNKALFGCHSLRQLLGENESEFYAFSKAAAEFWDFMKSSRAPQPSISSMLSSTDISSSLSPEQKEVYDRCMSMAESFQPNGPSDGSASSKILLVLGAAGCGKSRIIDALRQKLENAVAITATTGTAAYNVRGSTICSFAALHRDVLGPEAEAGLRDRLDSVRLLIVDETSMLKMKDLIKIEERIKVPLVLFGDFRQAPPVGGEPLWEHPEFDEWEKLLLEKVYRQQDPIFKSLLERVARGEMTNAAFKYLIENASTLSNSGREANFVSSGVQHLCGTNEEVNSINEFNIRRALSTMPVDNRCAVKIPVLRRDAPTNESLYLCSDAPVLLVKNLNVRWGMTNGSAGTAGAVLYHKDAYPSQHLPAAVLVKFHDRPNPGFLAWVRETHRLLLGPEHDSLSEYVPVPPEFSRSSASNPSSHQVPLRLNWGKTIHKSQAQTLERVIIRIPRLESQNLTYVALSRVTSITGLVLSNVPWLTEDRLVTDINKQTDRSKKVEEIYRNLRSPLWGEPEYLSYLRDDEISTH